MKGGTLHLEGWDFMHLPSIATLNKAYGKHFTRAIYAITLVGRGFGEIIQPVFVLTGLNCR